MQIRWFEGLTGLEQLRDDWVGLHDGADLYARFEWNQAVAKHLIPATSQLLYCRIGRPDGRVAAIVPAIVARVDTPPFGKRLVLTMGQHPHLSLRDFPLARDADPSAVGAALMAACGELPQRWVAVWWPRILAASNAARVACALAGPAAQLRAGSPCNTIDTSQPRKPRSNLRRPQKRLAEIGPTAVRLARESGKVEAFFGEFLRIEASGWKGATGTQTAIAHLPEARAFYAELLAQHGPGFEADIALLYCGDRAIAGEFLLTASRWQHVYKIGYDEAYREYSPGQLLLEDVLHRACARGSTDRVSLVSSQRWHENWKPLSEQTMEVLAFREPWRDTVSSVYSSVRRKAKHVRAMWSRPRADAMSNDADGSLRPAAAEGSESAAEPELPKR